MACFSGELTCANLKESNVQNVAKAIQFCVSFKEEILKCKGETKNKICFKIPKECDSSYYYHLFYFVLSDNIFAKSSAPVYTIVALPILQYNTYVYFERKNVSWKSFMTVYEEAIKLDGNLSEVTIVGANLGIKLEVLEMILLNDSIYPVLGLCLIALVIWLYAKSFFYTITVIASIVLSVGTAYFIYTTVFRIAFFPFMNLMVVVLLIGIGADDTFVLKYVFDSFKVDGSKQVTAQHVSNALSYSAVAMFVTSATTASAFYACIVSKVIVMQCFGLFAGTAILTNYLLVISILPASLIILDRYIEPFINQRCPKMFFVMTDTLHAGAALFSTHLTEQWLPFLVKNLKFLWLFIFSALFAVSFVVVFYKPGLSLPRRNPLILFSPAHPFEWYDEHGELHFRFPLAKYKMPMSVTIIWGFLPSDLRAMFQPKGSFSLIRNRNFNMSLEVLRDLETACGKLAKTSAFTFKDEKCFASTYFDWSAQQICQNGDAICCNYLSSLFEDKNLARCLYNEMKPFFESTESAALTVLNEAKTETVRNGWIVTTNDKSSTILTITAIILETVACLVLLNWKLNIIECTIIILTIGLSFDCTLHYAVAFKFTPPGTKEEKINAALKHIGTPVLMSAVTTAIAGMAMVFATTMVYIQVGMFMVIVT
ncbi:unnamed protein product, partial [Soboliphyme baturini]|uniref:SSD domain-containing protein n=1 Tax=Soboliphyme baturini TaxID=241478 RepID=A0A183J732_9BILA